MAVLAEPMTLIKQRALAKGVVAVSVGVENHRISTDGIVELACSQLVNSANVPHRGVVHARGVA